METTIVNDNCNKDNLPSNETIAVQDMKSSTVTESNKRDENDSFFEAIESINCTPVENKTNCNKDSLPSNEVNLDVPSSSCATDNIEDGNIEDGNIEDENIVDKNIDDTNTKQISDHSSTFEEVDNSLLNTTENDLSTETIDIGIRTNSEVSILANALKRKQRELESLSSMCYKTLEAKQRELSEAEAANDKLLRENQTLQKLLEYVLSDLLSTD